MLLPKTQAVYLASNVLSVKINALIVFHGFIKALDKVGLIVLLT